MKISVITVVFNNERTIKSTIDSVIGQSYPEVEYIVIDGGSTDKTIDIIRSYGKKVSKLISEKDEGIYDAMNKGIKAAEGDVICFLNSDDFYVDNQVLEKVAGIFNTKKVDSCYGDLYYVDKNDINKVIRLWRSQPYKKGIFRRGWYPPHPSFFVKKYIFDKYGGFNLKFKISADYELTLRFLEKYSISSYYLPEVLVKMRVGGESNRNILNILKANYECYKAWQENGLKYNIIDAITKPFNKARQYIRNKR